MFKDREVFALGGD
jgi:hypothetical protein